MGGGKVSVVGCLFLESVPILSIWQVFWLALFRPCLPMRLWRRTVTYLIGLQTLELTAAGLRRTLTCFPFHTPGGDQNGRKNTK